ncbi:dihydroorotate dehydrogenase-like protein [Roseimarinus sediminis]|jgi:dihydroorotate dehydrogenase (fumarate)|uniref:dihydroorotate dehydrogenase-like protein n=1 Tax=Roseimarinus sediminis TaxID=1610899 RepID=UPI003D19238B
MANLSTRFFGLDLKTPVIIGSSGLSNSIDKIKLLAENGAGAIVLKSVFEEEIYNEYQSEFEKQAVGHHNLEHLDYFDYEIKNDKIRQYLELIKGAKAEGVEVPLVASINCTSGSDWAFFAGKLAEAGADALELNLFVLPSDLNRTAQQVEDYYFKTIKKVLETVKIPVSIKLSPYFSDLARMVKALSETGIAGITLFNRFYNIDIDIENRELVPAKILSHPFEYLQSLRWIGLLSGHVQCELAASTGVHDQTTTIKMIMAGASAVQVVSGIYKNGYELVKDIVQGLSNWMDEHQIESIDALKGMASAQKTDHPEQYERVQFMKYFGEFEN